MNLVPGGTFYRGYDGVTYTSMDYPATVSTFGLDVYEVTVGRFRKFVDAGKGTQAGPPTAGSGKHRHLSGGAGLNGGTEGGWDPGWNTNLKTDATALKAALSCHSIYPTWKDPAGTSTEESRPMNCITWYEAYAFCIWDGGFLPSEAEWNYAAAGGSEQRVYPWGATVPGANADLAVYGCYYNGTGTCTGVPNIAPVGAVAAGNGRFGQADLGGNVFEPVLDWWASSYTSECNDDCANLTGSTYRVTRSSDFSSQAKFLLASSRNNQSLGGRRYYVGARCARPP
jgi:formylglycine-generating enzyme